MRSALRGLPPSHPRSRFEPAGSVKTMTKAVAYPSFSLNKAPHTAFGGTQEEHREDTAGTNTEGCSLLPPQAPAWLLPPAFSPSFSWFFSPSVSGRAALPVRRLPPVPPCPHYQPPKRAQQRSRPTITSVFFSCLHSLIVVKKYTCLTATTHCLCG